MGTVLLVEDDTGIRQAYAGLLTDYGRSVVEASHGAEALALLASGERPCLIVLDLMMPVMDGVTFLAHLRQDADLRGLPVVVLSANPRLQAAAEAHGIEDYLLKPVDLDRLFDVVEAHCA